MQRILTTLLAVLPFIALSQTSIHQEQNDYYKSLGHTADDYYQINQPAAMPKSDRGTCTPEKLVFGWHPFWSNGLEVNYDWSLMTDFSYFSYEVDANTGDPLTTHNWLTNAAVTEALNQGLRVNLCVTLFSNHATLFNDPVATQNLIDNLITLVQQRGAHGVNIDFEGIALSQKANFTNFMIDLCNQMHAAIPGSQVSTVLYAVDWNNVIDVAALDPYVDLFIIMGYAYYWSGSSTAGPTDPLFHFGSSYNYTLSKTVTDNLEMGVTPSKLLLGLPFYGYEWETASLTVPSSTTGGGSARTYRVVENNNSGNYSNANYGWDADSYTRYYAFNDGVDNKQCFMISQYDFGMRLKTINRFGIGGMGIWALGYDDGYTDLWDEIYDKFTPCGSYVECQDTLFDMGGPNKNYYDDENYTFTLDPAGAASITVDFQSFDVEANFDYLYIYDGADINAPQITGSPFTGTNSPGNFTSSGGALTFRFVSDGATTAPGWLATYACATDNTPPSTAVTPDANWKTMDYTVSFTDVDGESGIQTGFWNVSDLHNGRWSSNTDLGFLNDRFDTGISDWTQVTGTWTGTGNIQQTDEAEGNSNAYIDLIQDDNASWMYSWKMMMDGTGTNRRAGIHFFCDDPSLSNRGNGYFVYYRVDNDKAQLYKVVNNTWTLQAEGNVTIDPAMWYDCKIIYDPNGSEIQVFLDDEKVLNWVDPSPHTNASAISLRTGGCEASYDDFMVFRSRTSSETVTVGSTGSMVRFQNPDPMTAAARVFSLATDMADNISTLDSTSFNIDWSIPELPDSVADGSAADQDVFSDPTTYIGNWTAFQDTNSGIQSVEYSLSTTPGGNDVVNWTPTSMNNVNLSGLSLQLNTLYYFNLRSENGAGLSASTNSDGFVLVTATGMEEITLELNAWPNPVVDDLHLQLQNTTTFTYELYDMNGCMMERNSVTGELVTIPFSSYASGTYLIRITTDEGTKTTIRVVK